MAHEAKKLHASAQWSEGVTKPIKKYSQIDTVWDFLINFGCKIKRIIALKRF